MEQIPKNVQIRSPYPNELIHSAGPWKEHKYLRKYKNSKGKWIYVYANKETHEKYMNTRRDERFLKTNSVATKLKLPFLELKNTVEKIKWKKATPKKNPLKKYTTNQKNAINNKNQMEKFTASTPKKNPLLVSQKNREKAAQRQKNTATYLKAKTAATKKPKKYTATQKRYYDTQAQNERINKAAEETRKKNVLKNRGNRVMHSDTELIHSAGPWKDHKYVSKHKGKNGKWVYVYKLIDAVSSTKGLGLINKIGKGVNKASEDVPKAVAEAKASRPKVETKPKRIDGATYALTDSNIKPKKVKKPTWMKSSKKTTRVALAHSAKGTSWEKKDHKYVSKEVKNGKTYYKYNPKTKTYQHVQLTKDDLAPQTPSESAKMMVDSSTMGLDKAREKMLAKRGIYTKEALINKSNIDGKLLVSKASGGHARRKSNRR